MATAGPGPLHLELVRRPAAGVVDYRVVLRDEWGPAGTVGVVLDAPGVAPPGAGSLELRASGLWADHVCEEPLRRWTVGLEAFAVAVDDEALLEADDPFGVRVPLGADLEWEDRDDAVVLAAGSPGYRTACRVTGEVLVGHRAYELDGPGTRSHTWGA